jgi:hypothetical protein
MKVGAEPKKIAFLAVLGVIGVYVLWSNLSSSSDPSGYTPKSGRSTPSASLPQPDISRAAPTRQNRPGTNLSQGFHPNLKAKKPGEGANPLTADPTLRLDLLDKLKEVKIGKIERSLFDFVEGPAVGSTPPVTIKVKPIPPPATLATTGPNPPPPVVKPPDPVAPPIPLKFYGFASNSRQGVKRAFFLDGEDIVVVSEGDLVKKRYKLVRIGVNAATMQDTLSMGMQNSEQQLPLVPEQQS